jgi:hypothetical protein
MLRHRISDSWQTFDIDVVARGTFRRIVTAVRTDNPPDF